jgi:hypothetical protein
MEQNLEPINAELDPFTIYQVPPHVTAVQVGSQLLLGPDVQLLGGYNVTLLEVDDTGGLPIDSAVIPPVTRIVISAVPGSGLGVFPDCDETPDVKTINGVPGNSHQNFLIDAEGCITFFRPVSVTSLDPREVEYQSPGLSADQAAAAMQIGNHCTPCCDCVYFVRTYKGLYRQWELYRESAEVAAVLRGDYIDISERWLTQKSCRETNTLQAIASADGNSKSSWGVVHCNASKCCILNVELRLTWVYTVNGIVQLPNVPGYDCYKSTLTGAAGVKDGTPIFSSRSADTQGIVNVFHWPRADRQSTVAVVGRHCFPEAETSGDDVVQIIPHFVVSWASALPNPDTDEVCEYPLLDAAAFPAQVLEMWSLTGDSVPANARSQFFGEPVTVRTDDPYCERCDCDTPLDNTPVTPRRFQNVCVWYDAADTRTLDIEDTFVTQWRSKRGNSIQLSVPLGLSPPTYADGLLQFNGVNNGLSQRFQTLPYSPGYIAGVFTASGANQILLTSRSSVNPAEFVTLSSTSVRFGSLPLTTGLGPAGLNILIGTANGVGLGVEQQLYFNGTLVGTNTINRDGAAEGIFVGMTSDFSSFLNGSLGELLLGCEVLLTPDRQILEGYLAAKWGIQSKLPADHPYRNAIPLGPA